MNDDKLNLITNSIKGDKQSLAKLLKLEQANIYATLFYMNQNECDALDIMQNVLIKIAKKIHQLKKPKNFKTWLNQLILNTYYDFLRKSKRQNKHKKIQIDTSDSFFEIPDLKRNPQDRILYSELDNIIKESIDKLPLHYKIPITLREVQGLSYEQISNIERVSLGTVKSRIARARTMIKNDILSYTRG